MPTDERCLICGRQSDPRISCASIDGEHEWPSEQHEPAPPQEGTPDDN